MAQKRDESFRLFVCVIPNDVWQNCRPQSIVLNGLGRKLSPSERRLRVRGQRDLFEDFEPAELFDAIFLIHTLEHIEQPIDLLRRIGTWLAKGGRLFLAVRGQVTHVTGTRAPAVLAALGENKELGALIANDWNSVHLTARGNILMHSVNGHLMAIVIDDDIPNRTLKGLIGVQVHVGGPMKVEYRNIRLKNW